MAFKGDVGQISLLNIYQALNLNQQGGILTVSSGRVKRKIRFQPEGIRLISVFPGDPDPLRPILKKLKILTDSQFQNVFNTKSETDLPLGDYLIQRRIIDQETVAGPICKHVLELIFETFFWKPAKYEFCAGDDAHDYEFISPDGPGHHLTFRVESVLMEVARREDEWQRINDSIKSEKEIFTPVEGSNFSEDNDYGWEVTADTVLEIKSLIDSQRSVECIAKDATTSKYEAFRAIDLLKSGGEIRALTAPEKKQLADKLRKKFKIKEVVDIYSQLLLDDPDDIETRSSLIAILEKRKELEEQLVQHYEYFADHYIQKDERSTGKRYLDRVLSIDKHCLVAREKLFDLHIDAKKEREALGEARLIVEAVKVTKEYSEGAILLEKILRAFPNETPLYHECSDFHQFDGNAEEAIRNLKSAASVYQSRNDYTRLRKTYERIASLDPSENATLRKYQELERKTRRTLWKKLIPSLVSSVAASLVIVIAYWVLSDVMCRNAYASVSKEVDTLVDNGSYEEATIVLSQLKAIYPVSSLRWEISQRIDSISESKRRLVRKQAVQAEQKNTHFTSYLAHVTTLLRDKRYTQAIKEIKKYDRLGLSEANLAKLTEIETEIQSIFAKAKGILTKAKGLTKAGKHKEAHPYYIELLMKYSSTPSAWQLEIPIVLQSMPQGADVLVNGKRVGKTPMLFPYRPFKKFELRLRKPGFADHRCGENDDLSPCFDFSRDWAVNIAMHRLPDWRHEFENAVQGLPVLSDNKLIVADARGTVLCLKRDDGKILWSQKTRSDWGLRGELRVWQDRVYFGSSNGHLIALDMESGTSLLYSEPMRDQWHGPLFAGRSTDRGLVGVIGGSQLLGMQLRDGSVSWSQKIPNLIEAAPSLADNDLICCTNTGKIFVIDANRGNQKQTIDLKVSISRPGTENGGSYYVTDTRGIVYRIDLKSGGIVWSNRSPDNNLSSPVAEDSGVLVGSDKGYLLALDTSNGVRKWDLKVDDHFPWPGLIYEDKYIMGSKKGLVLCLDRESGTVEWTFQADGRLVQPPIVDGDTMVIVNEKNTAYSFTLD